MSKNRSYWIIPATVLLATASLAAEKHEVTTGGFGCVDKQTMLRIMDLQARQDDTTAARTVLDRGLAAKDCRIMEVGSFVYVEDDDVSQPKWICMRPVGDPDCYWGHTVMLRKRR